MSTRSSPWAVIATALVAIGCQSKSNDSPTLQSLSPNTVSSWAPTPVTINGANLFSFASGSFSSDQPPTVNRTWIISLDDTPISATEITYVDPTRIDIIVPGGLAEGTYQVSALSPDGRLAGPAQPLQVVDRPINFALSIETAPDGEGNTVANTALVSGDELVVHAVVRDTTGGYLRNVDAAWSVSGGIGAIGAGPSSSTTLTAQAVGSGVISATNIDLADASTGTITVVAGPAMSIAAETAADGSGAPVPAQTLTTDDTLQLFAISRDAFGNFVANVPVTWNVVGGIGTIVAGPATSASFDPRTVGVGTIEIDHPTLTTFGSGTLTVIAGRVASFDVSPDTGFTYIGGGPTIPFMVTNALDADGNTTTDTGTISWSSDPQIATIDLASGVLTPTLAGSGTVTATSSHGATDATNRIDIYPTGLVITSVTVPANVTRGQRNVALDVNLLNATSNSAALIDVRAKMSRAAADVGGDYIFTYDYRNPTTIGPGATVTVRYYVNVLLLANLGAIDIDVEVLGYFVSTSMFASDTESTMWVVDSRPVPTALITGPIYPNNRVCIGQPVDFVGSTSVGAVSHAWTFSTGSPATSSTPDPTGITYGTVGQHPYSLSVSSASGAVDSIIGPTPIFVGQVASPAFITGEVVFEKPAVPGEDAPIDNLPKIDMAGDGDATNMQTCDGATLLESDTNAYMTVFVDRGEIDPARDQDLSIPGIQVELHAGNHFDDVNWLTVTPMTEGKAIVYAEYRRISDGAVTAAGWIPVTNTNDDIDPRIDATLPLAACNVACYGKGEQWVVRFDEPMDATSLQAFTRIYLVTGSCASGSRTDITAGSSIVYDEDTRTLTVIPQVQSMISYPILIEIDKNDVFDKSSNANELNDDFALCAVVEDRPTPTLPSAVTVANISANPVTPDGDGDDESTAFQITTDAATVIVRLEIERGPTKFFSSRTPVSGAGTHTVSWNGRDGTGRVLPNGFYVYRVTAENPVGVRGPPIIGVIEVRSAVSFVGVPRWK